MTRNVAVYAQNEYLQFVQSITAASTSSGTAIASSAETVRVIVTNLSTNWPIEYRVDSGAWATLTVGKYADLAVDLSKQTISVRRDRLAPASTDVDVKIYTRPDGVFANGSATPTEVVPPGGAVQGAGISADAGNALTLGTDDKAFLALKTINGGSILGSGDLSVAGAYEVADGPALIALTGIPNGRTYRVLAPVMTGGPRGTAWTRDSAAIGGWRPAGRQVIGMLRTQVDGLSGGTTAEQIMWSPQLTAPLLGGVNALILQSRVLASGIDANARFVWWRIGTTGTASDAPVAVPTMTAGARIAVAPQHLSVASATALVWLNTQAQPVSPDALTNNAAAAAAPATVPDMTANNLFITLSVQQLASPTQQMSVSRAWIIVE